MPSMWQKFQHIKSSRTAYQRCARTKGKVCFLQKDVKLGEAQASCEGSTHGRHKRMPSLQEADKVVPVFAAHAEGTLGNQEKVPSMSKNDIICQIDRTYQRSS